MMEQAIVTVDRADPRAQNRIQSLDESLSTLENRPLLAAHDESSPASRATGELLRRIVKREAHVAVVGLGYVGLPLAMAATEGGFNVVGLDIDAQKVAMLNAAQSYIQHVSDDQLAKFVAQKKFFATTAFSAIRDVDAVLICVPTPLTRHREPDLSYVVSTVECIAQHLRPGQLIVLESTTYPGTTRDIVRPLLERTALKSGDDFLLAYSPEREDPGNPEYLTTRIPKVIGADSAYALEVARSLYERIVAKTVPVSSLETAEAVKLTENIFRAVNIALVNELKLIYEPMGIDIWEVVEAAKTKPFGYMAFYPGPGLGGHCIPIDPFYLTWKARAFGITTRLIETAGEINTSMPRHVVDHILSALSDRYKKSLNGAQILIVGVAYKRNVNDVRESPAFRLIELLTERGAAVEYHDPHVPEVPPMREHPAIQGLRSVSCEPSQLRQYDAAVIVTDHDDVDYRLIVENCPLVVDTRNVCARRAIAAGNVVKA
ncbi:nucleotide sugar dehydrogenase [Paraburkholderia mimosarum]|uniref:nucleotide sugar dehydrogenase n=1 Tax=Paraburkholderia mimosarum TaxID=312026 RepID=UPI001FC7E731|nr:nucleotide sugar dehydrogenase [Paraburkholderia mimosarum]